PDGRVLTANRALARLLGYASPEALVNSVTDAAVQVYVDPEDRATIVRQLLERGTAEAFECRFRRQDGQIIWILQNARAVFDESGRPLYFEGTVEDSPSASKRRRNASVWSMSATSSFRAFRTICARLSRRSRRRLA